MKELSIVDVSSIYTNKKREKVLALKHVSFKIKSFDFLTILGPTGCGKTTLLKCIAGFQPYAGKICFDGVDIDEIAIKERNIAYITQEPSLFPKMTIFDNIAFPLKITQVPYDEINQRVTKICAEMGILHLLSRKPKHLSKGQQQKVCIAKALVKRADLYLFDEPFSALDEVNTVELGRLLKKLSLKINVPFIYVTHNQQEAIRLGSQMLIMNEGKIEQFGSPWEIVNNPANKFVEEFMVFEKSTVVKED